MPGPSLWIILDISSLNSTFLWTRQGPNKAKHEHQPQKAPIWWNYRLLFNRPPGPKKSTMQMKCFILRRILYFSFIAQKKALPLNNKSWWPQENNKRHMNVISSGTKPLFSSLRTTRWILCPAHGIIISKSIYFCQILQACIPKELHVDESKASPQVIMQAWLHFLCYRAIKWEQAVITLIVGFFFGWITPIIVEESISAKKTPFLWRH